MTDSPPDKRQCVSPTGCENGEERPAVILVTGGTGLVGLVGWIRRKPLLMLTALSLKTVKYNRGGVTLQTSLHCMYNLQCHYKIKFKYLSKRSISKSIEIFHLSEAPGSWFLIKIASFLMRCMAFMTLSFFVISTSNHILGRVIWDKFKVTKVIYPKNAQNKLLATS